VKIEKQLTEKENKILDKELKRLDNRIKVEVKILIGWTVVALVVGIFVYFRLETVTELYLLIGTEAIYILIGVWIFLESYIKNNRRRKNIEFVKAKNKMTLIKVTSKDYIELSEEDDEGVFYLFQLPGNRILSFGGQEFYPTRRFPSDEFEIVICYGMNGEIVLMEKYNYGKKVKPKLKVKGKKKWDLIASPKYPDPDNFTIINGRLEDIHEIEVR
jgi:hypothetical protein